MKFSCKILGLSATLLLANQVVEAHPTRALLEDSFSGVKRILAPVVSRAFGGERNLLLHTSRQVGMPMGGMLGQNISLSSDSFPKKPASPFNLSANKTEPTPLDYEIFPEFPPRVGIDPQHSSRESREPKIPSILELPGC